MGKHTRPGGQDKMCGQALSWQRLLPVLATGCCWSGLLTGCTGMNQAAVGGADPLVGGVVPVKTAAANPAAGTTTAGTAPEATASTPPIPIPISSTSPAALASSTPRSQTGGNDLRIASPRTSPNRDGWNTQPAPAAGTNPNPMIYANATMPAAASATITPLRAQDSTPRPEPLPMVSPVSLPIGPKQEPTLDQLYAQLNARGMLYQKLDSNTDNTEWTFTCIVPRKSDPNVRRTYTGRASSSVGAVRVVLDQIDKDS